jgi:hypothetical protein
VKKLIRLALALWLAMSVPAQAQQTWVEFPLFSTYDLDSTSYIYCVTAGERGQVLNAGSNNGVRISVTSTAATATVASSAPFAAVDVGDEITIITPSGANAGLPQYKLVTARADANNITLDSALTADVTNVQFSWRDRTCGTGATNGWFPVHGFGVIKASFIVTQISVGANSVDMKVECRDSQVGADPTVIYGPGLSNYRSGGYTAANQNDAVVELYPWSECRMGLRINTADDGSDTGADAEKLSGKVVLSGRRP